MARLSGLDTALTSCRRALMTYTSQTSTSQASSAVFAPGDFRVGPVISRSVSVMARHFPSFFIVGLIAFSPLLLLRDGTAAAQTDSLQALITIGLCFVLLMVLSMFSSAI